MDKHTILATLFATFIMYNTSRLEANKNCTLTWCIMKGEMKHGTNSDAQYVRNCHFKDLVVINMQRKKGICLFIVSSEMYIVK